MVWVMPPQIERALLLSLKIIQWNTVFGQTPRQLVVKNWAHKVGEMYSKITVVDWEKKKDKNLWVIRKIGNLGFKKSGF